MSTTIQGTVAPPPPVVRTADLVELIVRPSDPEGSFQINDEGRFGAGALTQDANGVNLVGLALALGELAADPPVDPDEAAVYAKDVAGTSQVFARSDDGTVHQLTPAAAASPGGANTNVQFNNAGAFDGNADFTYDGTDVSIANALNVSEVQLVDNVASALAVLQGANSYLDIDTLNGNENVVVGSSGGVTPNVFLRAGATELEVHESDGFLATIPDNTSNAFRIAEGALNTYFAVNTNNGTESVQIGTSNTNPLVNVRGSGGLQADAHIDLPGLASDPFVESADGSGAAVSGAATGRLRYNNSTGLWEVSTQASAYAALLTANNTGAVAFNIPDNTTRALVIQEGANEYLECTTTNGASILRLGNVGGGGEPNVIQLSLTNGQSGALQVDAAGNIYFQIDTIGGTKLVFGNAATDPTFEFVGNGPVQLGTAGGHNNFLRILDRTGDPPAAPGAGDVYTKDVAGLTELFYQDDTNQVTQLTSNNQIGAAASAAYTRNATIVEDRTLLASASATTTNNNNVLAALIADLQAKGILG